MKTFTNREEPAKRPSARSDRGTPMAYSAQASRKDLSVRVLLMPSAADGDELREPGYGHGV